MAIEGLSGGLRPIEPPPPPVDSKDAGRVDKDTPFVQGNGDNNAIHENDVDQDGLNSCAVMSTIKAIAAQNPDVIKNMIRDNGDGSYTVTFKEYDNGIFGIGAGWKNKEVTVRGPFDGAAADPGDVKNGQREIWPAIIERAYEQYSKLNFTRDGENAGNVQQAILGREPTRAPPSNYSAADLQNKVNNGEAVTALTPDPSKWNDDQKKIADQYNVSGWHWYRVEGTYVDKDGTTRIKLDNPWGTDDVDMPYADYQKIYVEVDSTPTR